MSLKKLNCAIEWPSDQTVNTGSLYSVKLTPYMAKFSKYFVTLKAICYIKHILLSHWTLCDYNGHVFCFDLLNVSVEA